MKNFLLTLKKKFEDLKKNLKAILTWHNIKQYFKRKILYTYFFIKRLIIDTGKAMVYYPLNHIKLELTKHWKWEIGPRFPKFFKFIGWLYLWLLMHTYVLKRIMRYDEVCGVDMHARGSNWDMFDQEPWFPVYDYYLKFIWTSFVIYTIVFWITIVIRPLRNHLVAYNHTYSAAWVVVYIMATGRTTYFEPVMTAMGHMMHPAFQSFHIVFMIYGMYYTHLVSFTWPEEDDNADDITAEEWYFNKVKVETYGSFKGVRNWWKYFFFFFSVFPFWATKEQRDSFENWHDEVYADWYYKQNTGEWDGDWNAKVSKNTRYIRKQMRDVFVKKTGAGGSKSDIFKMYEEDIDHDDFFIPGFDDKPDSIRPNKFSIQYLFVNSYEREIAKIGMRRVISNLYFQRRVDTNEQIKLPELEYQTGSFFNIRKLVMDEKYKKKRTLWMVKPELWNETEKDRIAREKKEKEYIHFGKENLWRATVGETDHIRNVGPQNIWGVKVTPELWSELKLYYKNKGYYGQRYAVKDMKKLFKELWSAAEEHYLTDYNSKLKIVRKQVKKFEKKKIIISHKIEILRDLTTLKPVNDLNDEKEVYRYLMEANQRLELANQYEKKLKKITRKYNRKYKFKKFFLKAFNYLQKFFFIFKRQISKLDKRDGRRFYRSYWHWITSIFTKPGIVHVRNFFNFRYIFYGIPGAIICCFVYMYDRIWIFYYSCYNWIYKWINLKNLILKYDIPQKEYVYYKNIKGEYCLLWPHMPYLMSMYKRRLKIKEFEEKLSEGKDIQFNKRLKYLYILNFLFLIIAISIICLCIGWLWIKFNYYLDLFLQFVDSKPALRNFYAKLIYKWDDWHKIIKNWEETKKFDTEQTFDSEGLTFIIDLYRDLFNRLTIPDHIKEDIRSVLTWDEIYGILKWVVLEFIYIIKLVIYYIKLIVFYLEKLGLWGSIKYLFFHFYK